MPRARIDGADTPDEETLTFEEQIVRRVTAAVSAGVMELVAAILSAFEATKIANGGEALSYEQSMALGNALADRIVIAQWDPMHPIILEVAVEAHRLGVDRAAQRFPDAKDRVRASSVRAYKPKKIPNPDKALREELTAAARMARTGIKTSSDAAAVAGKLKAGKARIEGQARWVANRGINAGTVDVAKKMRLRLLWVSERNACLDCLAHAGYAIDPGGTFPGLSFDPLKTSTVVDFPPLHPNCRCQVRTFDGPAGPPPSDRSSLSPAARLAAEARRSVVYQWTEYESGPAARRAAEALLKAGAGLPASVEARARRALKKKR